MSHRGECHSLQVDRVLLRPLQLWDWGDSIVLDCPQIPDEEHHLILREEVEAAVKALKMEKSAIVDNIPAELVQAGWEAMIDILTTICNTIWKTGEWPTTWTQSLVITLPKKGNLQLCQNHPKQTPGTSRRDHCRFQSEGAPQNKYSISGSSARNTCSISRIFTISSWTSRRPLTAYGTKLYGQLWGNTTSMPASYEPLKICMTRPRVQSYSMAALANGSELQ